MTCKNTFLAVEEAQKKITRYCLYQDRCHKEVVQKLKEFKISPIAIDQILGQLIQDDYLNETRFAKSFARGKFRIKKWGRIRIIYQLKFREISSWNIKKAMQEIDDSEYLLCLQTLLDEFWLRYSYTGIILCKKKVFTALKYRGWETELIYEAIERKVKSQIKLQS